MVTIKLVEPGHTFMSANSFHALVENGIKKKKLQDFQDLVDIVNDRGEAMVLKSNDFFKVEKNLSSAQYASDKPYLEDVQVVRFLCGSEKLHWKRSNGDDEFESALFLKKKGCKTFTPLFPLSTNEEKLIQLKKKRLLNHFSSI